MAIPAVLLGMLPNMWNSAKEYLERKQAVRKLDTEAEIRIKSAEIESKIRRAESADLADSKIDTISVENTGWKDEYLLILTTSYLAIIMVSPFVDLAARIFVDGYTIDGKEVSFVYYDGLLIEAVNKGFAAMEKAPDYYWYALAAVYIHSLGMRRLFSNLLENGFNFRSKK